MWRPPASALFVQAIWNDEVATPCGGGLMAVPIWDTGPTCGVETRRGGVYLSQKNRNGLIPTMPKLNWWAGVCLCRAGAKGGDADEVLARGQLCELLWRATEVDPAEQPRLFIVYELTDRRLSWSRMQELIARPDFPIFI